MRGDLILRGAVRRIEGPLLYVRRSANVGLNEAVQIIDRENHQRVGRIAALDEDTMIIEVLESTTGLGLDDTQIRLRAEPLVFAVGPGLLGRVFDSVGRPVDGGPPVPADRRMRIDGLAINPSARALPRDFIETTVSTIDLMNSLVRGQKLPLFSCGGLPHDKMATEIAQRARLRGGEAGQFAIVFVGIGVPHDTAEAFRSAMESSGALEHTVMFLNRADEPSTQRLLTPRYALTAAEYLAFVEGRHVLVILTDMTNYCEAMREVSASHGEIPSRKGYPGYMYSDLATLYERAGCIKGLPGTVTQLPILTMPGDDIGHPIPDLTGYITEGQIVLGRELDRKGVYPPVSVLPSLSRLMDNGTGEGYTHKDHPNLAHQLFAAYARATRVRVLASVMGQEGLSDTDKRYLHFGDIFESELVNQAGARSLEESMDIAWRLLRVLPEAELARLSDEQIERYIREETEVARRTPGHADAQRLPGAQGRAAARAGGLRIPGREADDRRPGDAAPARGIPEIAGGLSRSPRRLHRVARARHRPSWPGGSHGLSGASPPAMGLPARISPLPRGGTDRPALPGDGLETRRPGGDAVTGGRGLPGTVHGPDAPGGRHGGALGQPVSPDRRIHPDRAAREGTGERPAARDRREHPVHGGTARGRGPGGGAAGPVCRSIRVKSRARHGRTRQRAAGEPRSPQHVE